MTAEALRGAVAQLGERRPCKAEVVGSSPICSTNSQDLVKSGLTRSYGIFEWSLTTETESSRFVKVLLKTQV